MMCRLHLELLSIVNYLSLKQLIDLNYIHQHKITTSLSNFEFSINILWMI
jgi:hypothetical protein